VGAYHFTSMRTIQLVVIYFKLMNFNNNFSAKFLITSRFPFIIYKVVLIDDYIFGIYYLLFGALALLVV